MGDLVHLGRVSLPADARLDAALGDAARARLRRGLVEVGERLSRLSLDAPDDPVDELARQVRAVLRVEELAEEASLAGAGASTLERLLSAQQIAAPAAREVVTSLEAGNMPPRVLGAVAAALAELVAMVTADCTDRDDLRLYVTSGLQDGEVVVAFAAQGAVEISAQSDAAAEAFRRADKLMTLAGGTLVRGTSAGMLVVGLLVAPGAGAGD